MDSSEVKERILALTPKICPACGSALNLSDDLMHLTCTNSNCCGKMYRRMEIMAKAFQIPNIGIKVAQELQEACNITSLDQMFKLTVEDILQVPRYQQGMAEKLYKSIHNCWEVTWAEFLRGIQLTRVGEGTANELAKKVNSLAELISLTPTELASIMDHATENLTIMIVDSIQNQKEEILALAECVEIKYPKKETVVAPMQNITAVVTGKLEFGNRKAFQEKYGEAYGVKWASAVSKNTDYLVTNEASTSSKYKKATELGVPALTEKEFLEKIGVAN